MKKLFHKSLLLGIALAIVGFFIGYIVKQLPTLEEFRNVKEVEDLVKILVENWDVIAAFIILRLLFIFFRHLQLQQQIQEVFEKITGTSSNKPKKSKPKNILIKKISQEVNSRLEQSLHNRVYIVLNQERDSTQVENPYEIDVKVGDKPKIRLKKTEVATVFDQPDVAGRLLILGQPGYGKTTMLLKLAEKLVERAKEDSTQPIPVIFSLPTWKNDNQNIKDWLIEQLKEKYGVRKDIGKQWVDNEEIIPLLDGLDELAAKRQELCVKKINEFLESDYSTNPLVICSRTEEYQNYQTKLQLNTSLELCSYTPEQIYEYLRYTDNQELWDGINNNPDLSDLAKTPLLLNIIVIAAGGISIEKWQEFKSKDERLSYLLDVYIRQMFGRKYNGKKPNEKKTRDWLGWLAQRLIQEDITEFFIENMQPYWLNNLFQTIPYNMITWGVISGIIFGCITPLFITFIAVIIKISSSYLKDDININLIFNTVFIGVIIGVFYGLIYGLIGKPIKSKIEKIKIPTTLSKKFKLINTLLTVFIQVSITIIYGLLFGNFGGNSFGFFHGFIFALIYNLFINQIIKKIIFSSLKSNRVAIQKLVYVTFWCLSISLTTLVFYWVISRLFIEVNYEVNTLIALIFFGVFIGVIIEIYLDFIGNKIQTIESLKFNIKKSFEFYRLHIRTFFIIFMTIGLILGIINAITFYTTGIYVQNEAPFIIYLIGFMGGFGIFFGIFGVILGLILGLFFVIDSVEIENKILPNQGIIKSTINTLILSLWGWIFATSLMLIPIIITSRKININEQLFVILILGLIFGILIGMLRSGTSVIKHFVLRVILWLSGYMPWNYARFLDYCTNRLFLQRVGGSYRFMHDLLRQHFAKQYRESSKANAS